MEYKFSDKITPILDLPSPCSLSVRVDDDNVVLKVGPRDVQWDRKTGKFIGCGTDVSNMTRRKKRQ